MRYYSYLNTASKIINTYKGDEPLSVYLKKFFSSDKRYGSKDRKLISHSCYCYFRLGKMATDLPADERILLGLFLCTDKPGEMLAALKPGWIEHISNTTQNKIEKSGFHFSVSEIFPWKSEMSEGIDYDKFCESFLIQPGLFLRLRPGYEKTVQKKLIAADINFSIVHSNCLELSNSSKVDAVVELDKEAVVQDLNSQKVGELFRLVRQGPSGKPEKLWDCCAASGGKSLMLHDLFPDIDLTVSDKRESILVNLRKRFEKAGITNYESFIADLSIPLKQSQKNKYNLIIADVPCSGSGTWSRTPEQLYFFDGSKIIEYSNLQKKIVNNVIPFLEPGGYLLYITCSVFKKENEEVAAFLKERHGLELKHMQLFAGYDKKADTLFAALFYKPL